MSSIQTRRLFLRPFTEADVPVFLAMQQDERVNRFLPWWPPQTEHEAQVLLQRRFLAAEAGQSLAIILQARQQLIGYLTLATAPTYDLGYGLTPKAWGQGYATEAVRGFLAQLPATVPYVTATHDVLNPKSGAVMQRAGMRYQYTYREQWQPKNIPVDFRLYLLNRDGQNDRQFPLYWN